MSLKTLRIVCAAVFVCGIAGLIASSVAGNNNGTVLSAGIPTTFAAIALLAASAVTRKEPIDVFDDAKAERLEDQIQAIVAHGAPEVDVRGLVRDAIGLGRGS